MSAPTIVIVGRREFQLDANFTACWILALLLRLQTQLFKTESVDGFFVLSLGSNQLPLPIVSLVCLMAGLYLREYQK